MLIPPMQNSVAQVSAMALGKGEVSKLYPADDMCIVFFSSTLKLGPFLMVKGSRRSQKYKIALNDTL